MSSNRYAALVLALLRYQDLGANVIQTFCVSYNGYAWYGFDKADAKTTLPSGQPAFNARNIQILHEAYHSI